MTKLRAYVETTIPSFYFEDRTAADVVARREWTRLWWQDAPSHYELVTGVTVLEELKRGVPEMSARRLALVEKLPALPIERIVLEIVETYIRHQVMPADPNGDAWYLALASHHKCDFLVTWNCPAPCQCQQIRSYSENKYDARAFCPVPRDTFGVAWRI